MKLHHTDSLIYAAIAYDSFWISALSLDRNSTDDKYNDKKNNTKSFKDIVITTSESFPGISGKIELNEAGDRIGENYDFWRVSKHPQKDYYVWKSEGVPVETNY
jgi:ABC-type branched-subunit amino acid transport system substrate-binding protein